MAQAQLDEATRADLEAKHGKVLVLSTEIGDEVYEAAFRAANAGEWQRFIDEAYDKERASRASRALVVSCVVWPSEVEFAAMIKARPGLVQSFYLGRGGGAAGVSRPEARRRDGGCHAAGGWPPLPAQARRVHRGPRERRGPPWVSGASTFS
jgi:hypothetical protein